MADHVQEKTSTPYSNTTPEKSGEGLHPTAKKIQELERKNSMLAEQFSLQTKKLDEYAQRFSQLEKFSDQTPLCKTSLFFLKIFACIGVPCAQDELEKHKKIIKAQKNLQIQDQEVDEELRCLDDTTLPSR